MDFPKPSESNILSLVEDIRQAAVKDTTSTTGSPDTHFHLLSLIDQLRLAVEAPTETVLRLIYQPSQNAALRTLIDLGVFKLLVSHGTSSLLAEELSTYTKAEKGLIVRLMRVATALGLCDNPEHEVYKPNTKTGIMTHPIGRDGVQCIYDLTMPTLSKLPSYFAEHNYTLPIDYNASPMHWAIGQSQFEWLASNHHQQGLFNSYMASRREGRPAWFDVYPVERLTQIDCASGSDSGPNSYSCSCSAAHGKEEGVFLVDIGGNQGHDLLKFRERFPDAPGRLVLQDLPTVIEGVDSRSGPGSECALDKNRVEAMGYSFFDPQPVKGARIYYFHSIFHDWPDSICLTIFRNTVSAMNPLHSRIIIVDFVLPDTETPLLQASLDIQMMSIGSGVERSRASGRSSWGK
ncbi:S-adenosyl-L-methionine-dependent methyltransferase [Aspergillus undulatus]|uniref:S-adenosyl-L-methionine-dependent methyltransferase n=1 Tax=Aspergillus undulatus TaxID=1810928 RepID=UPI003CCD2F35